jgi:hypothetical protein
LPERLVLLNFYFKLRVLKIWPLGISGLLDVRRVEYSGYKHEQEQRVIKIFLEKTCFPDVKQKGRFGFAFMLTNQDVWQGSSAALFSYTVCFTSFLFHMPLIPVSRYKEGIWCNQYSSS